LATNFESPLPVTLVATESQEIAFDNVLNQNNFFNPGAFLPQISGNYLVNWSFNVILVSGTPSLNYTATISCNNTETFTFVPTTTSTHYNFQAVMSSSGFSMNEVDAIVFSMTSPENATIHLTSNIVRIKYVSKLT
jgi:hypothetical protein